MKRKMNFCSNLRNALKCVSRVRIASVGAGNDAKFLEIGRRMEKIHANMPYSIPTDTYFHATKVANNLVKEDKNWSLFAFRHRLVERATIQEYDNVSTLVMTLRYFPTDVTKVHRAQTKSACTVVQDLKFVQRVNLLPKINGLEILCVDCVTHCDNTNPNESTITVATTDSHEEIGQHSVWVRRCPKHGDLWLEVVSVSRFKPWVPIFAQRYGRFLQNRSHRRAVQHLREAAAMSDRYTSVQENESKEIFQDVNDVDLSNACVLVTGASGFVGSHMLPKLQHAGATIVAVDKKVEHLNELSDQILWVQGDVSKKKQIEHVFDLAKQLSCENDNSKLFVVHLAAHWDYELIWNDKYNETNLVGTQNVIELSEKFNAERVVFASSLGVFSPHQSNTGPLKETSPLPPNIRGAYGQSKARGEGIIAKSICPSAIVRFGGVFSDYCELPPLHALVQAWTSTWPIYNRLFPGTLGNTAIPMVHVEDASNLLILALDRHGMLPKKQIYLACASDGSTFDNQRLFELLRKKDKSLPLFVPMTFVKWSLLVIHAFMKSVLPHKFHFFHVEQPWLLEEHCDRPLYLDCSHTKEILGWKPRNVEKAIEKMISTKKENPTEWKVRNSNRIAHL